MTALRKKIAFIRVYASVPIARSVPRMLAAAFPEYAVETITITQLLKRRPDILLLSSLHAVRTTGLRALENSQALRKAALGTPYLFRQVRSLLRERLEKQRAEYVFSFQLQSLFDASLPGLPHYVYTDHTHLANLQYAEFDRSQLNAHAWIELEKSIYDNADQIFTRSTNISHSLIEQYGCPPEKVTCVYAGVNVPASEEPPDNDRYRNKKILFVGIDWERKGGPQLVAAFRRVLKVHPDAQLLIVGCSPEVDLPNVQTFGKLPVEEVQRLYRQASIFCLPTRLEPFGIVFVEAMAHRLPIVATQIGAVPDMVIEGESGYLVEPDDIPALAERLIDLLDDPQKSAHFGAAGYRLAQDRYNWKTVGEVLRREISARQPLPGSTQPPERLMPPIHA
ncbi:MAG TPA: glycosyltransferase family 4 protein [Anaerolineales bacterium]|nr:glycosyltransferase family 4 protein [Anaerolineales bacterium]